ncbi:MAG: hypothetical protein ACLR9T_08425 [Thomasclavelia sp.]|uniref:hypothetical protein n=1 Tax=Thomasclavelia sp. TaxID=3025757 RepID=UPI00399F972B
MKFGVIAVGYSRPLAMKRLLTSLLEADYLGDKVDLIVSIDKGEKQNEIVTISKNINWPYGEKIIRAFDTNLGLRNHIIKCGDLTSDYDAVIVLEDDITVSRYFYNYAKQAVYRYSDNKKIAGISLYKHLTHPKMLRPFEPSNNGFDTFFMQYAQSWGQCWTKAMWDGFKNWYINNPEIMVDSKTPAYIVNWNAQSWLKYYIKYTIEKNMFYVYPYVSLTTNHSDVGEHCNLSNNDFQVPLQEGNILYRFPNLDEGIKYDAFFERMDIDKEIFCEIEGSKLIDLYGSRSDYSGYEYLISTKNLPYQIVKKIELKYRPHEKNCFSPSTGEGIYIYNLSKKDKYNKQSLFSIVRYDVKAIPPKQLLCCGLNELIENYKLRINNILKRFLVINNGGKRK